MVENSAFNQPANNALSKLIHHNKYAKYLEGVGRREQYEESVERNLKMHLRKFNGLGDVMKASITEAYQSVFNKDVLPSMRSMQFGGAAIEKNPARMYNCSAVAIDHPKAFSEVFFLLLSGCGVGYSVQKHHVAKLPAIQAPGPEVRFLVVDTIEGWAWALDALVGAYFQGKALPRFDYQDIRKKKSLLRTSGGRAPGHEPLEKKCLDKVAEILKTKPPGSRLHPIEAHDILCHTSNAVLSGGVRRSAYVSLFSHDDTDMLMSKTGNWFDHSPQRMRANNDACLLRGEHDERDFWRYWEVIANSGSGEPGLFWTNDLEWLFNPCFAGDTGILTPEGYRPIEDMVGECELVNEHGITVPGKVWSNGKKATLLLILSDKTHIRCTPEHRFLTVDNEDVQAQNLKGKRISPFYRMNKEVTDYTALGFLQGDGALGRLKSKDHLGLEVCIGNKDKEIAPLFGIKHRPEETSTYYVNGYNETLRLLGFSSNVLPERSMPSTYPHWSDKQKRHFLQGLFSANGCVIGFHRVSLKTTCRKLADEVVESLNGFKVKSYITTNKSKDVEFDNGTYTCRESYDVNISRYKSIVSFAEKIGFVHSYKRNALASLIRSKAPMVKHIREDQEMVEVFDFELKEGGTHWGVVEGVIAHNCLEASLRAGTFCNLVTLNAATIFTQAQLNYRARIAARLATMQATYTDFHFLRHFWKQKTEEDSLIGVSMTGIMAGNVMNLDLEEAATIIKEENARMAKVLGIREAKRTTLIKPEGTSSLALGGVPCGIHGALASGQHVRRVTLNKSEAIYEHILATVPGLLEDSIYNPEESYAVIPMEVPAHVPSQDEEGSIALLERIKHFHKTWVTPGHREGVNTNNVSSTVYVRDWDRVGKWMWENREHYTAIAVLPPDDNVYDQMMYESVSGDRHTELTTELLKLDLSNVKEEEDNTSLVEVAACAGGMCAV